MIICKAPQRGNKPTAQGSALATKGERAFRPARAKAPNLSGQILKKAALTLLMTLGTAVMSLSVDAAERPSATPAPYKGGFETGRYRNVFVEMGYQPEKVEARLKEVFDAVFRGPNKVYFEVGDTLGYVSDVKNHDARTEGMSYGMMIAVQFGEKDIFDRLWRWSKRYMQHQDGLLKGYFAWS